MLLQSIRKAVPVAQVQVEWLLAAGTVVSFGWLLVQDRIHPLVIYFLQLYLSF
ncbi:MAG TPA: hypothetical protein VFE44_02855 [Thermoanaerobaculia bacterium]|nr:hypothetical protein [Thermoanaerobaculia bacterium]